MHWLTGSMTASTLDRTAPTDVPVLDVLAERWSPRAFEATTPIDENKLSAALEAARWSPSAYNAQPWRFLVGRRGSELHERIHAALTGFNQTWAGDAAVLIVAIAETASADGKPISHAGYDLGQAVAHLTIQAHHDGLFAHQMSGFEPDAMRTVVSLEDRFVPMTVIALGELGDASTLSDVLQQRESAPRVRRPLSETVLATA